MACTQTSSVQLVATGSNVSTVNTKYRTSILVLHWCNCWVNLSYRQRCWTVWFVRKDKAKGCGKILEKGFTCDLNDTSILEMPMRVIFCYWLHINTSIWVKFEFTECHFTFLPSPYLILFFSFHITDRLWVPSRVKAFLAAHLQHSPIRLFPFIFNIRLIEVAIWLP